MAYVKKYKSIFIYKFQLITNKVYVMLVMMNYITGNCFFNDKYRQCNYQYVI